MKKIFFIFLLTVGLFGNNFDKYFSMAQNYYWLSIDEGIKSSVWFKTKKYLALAEKELKKEPNKQNLKKLKALKDEVNTFYLTKYYTMDGYFPMLKLVSTSFFLFPKKSRQHTLAKPADFIAVENTSESLTGRLKTLVQNHVFFNSSNPYWNEIAFEIFNANGKYYAHLTEEPKEILNNKELKDFYSNNITPDIIKKLLNYVNKSKVYIVRIEKTPLEKNDVYVTAYGEVYTKNGYNKDKSSITFGYSIDERGKWPVLILVHILLLGLALFLTAYFVKKTQNRSLYLIVLIGFIVGRVLPWVIVPSIESFMPNGDLNVLYTLWWVILVGIAIILAPIYAMDLIYKKIQNYIKLPSIAGKGGIIGLSISAGVLGYLFVPYIFTYGDVLSVWENILYFGLFSVAILISGYVSGKIFDKSDKTEEYYIIVFVITSAILFISLVHTDLIWLAISSILTIIASFLVIRMKKSEFVKEIKQKFESVEDIEKGLNQENYYEFEYYNDLIQKTGVKK